MLRAPVRAFALWLAVIFLGHLDGYARPTWIRASTDEVTIISDAPQKVVTEYAVKYSAFRQAFINLLAPAGHRPPPVVILLFRTDTEFTDHLVKSKDTSTHLVTYSTQVDNAALLALADAGDPDDALSMAFEFDTIWSLQRVGYFLPLWMTQGTGELLGTLRIKKGECIVDGTRARTWFTWDRGTPLPWPRFFDISQDAPEYKGPHADGVYQAQAMAIMNVALFQEKDPRARFAKLAKKIQDNRGSLQAVEEILDVPASQFAKAIQRQYHQDSSIAIAFDEKAILAGMKIVPAADWEVKIFRGELMLASGRLYEGNHLIDEAVALAPGTVAANEALARRSLRDNDQVRAAKSYRLAMEAGSVDTNAWLTSATEYLDQSADGSTDYPGGGRKNALTALDEIHRAIELDPGDRRARRLLGRAYFVAEKANEAGLAELSQAVTNEAEGMHIRYYRGLLYYRLGKMPEAMSDFAAVIANPATPAQLRGVASSFKMRVQFPADQAEIDRLVNAAQYDDARRLISAGATEYASTPLEESYRKMLPWVDERQSWAETVALYNQKDWPKAEAAALKFLEEFPDSRAHDDAQRLRESATKNKNRNKAAAVPKE